MKLFKLSPLYLVLSFTILISLQCPHKANAVEERPGDVLQWKNLSTVPEGKSGLSNIVSVSIGEQHSLALKDDGTVWAWGNNQNGQLGDGTTTNSEEPVQVKGTNGQGYLMNVKAIAAGQLYSMALKDDGSVWVWGFNGDSARGIDARFNAELNNLLFPHQIQESSSFNQIKAIAAGDNHSLALKSDGSVFAWGYNAQGQVGNGCSTGNCSSIFNPTKVFSDAISIAAGSLHSLAVKTDGTVWGWGRYVDGQLGTSHNNFGYLVLPAQINGLTNIKKVVAKNYSSAALDENNNVYTWGGFVYPTAGDFTPRKIPNLDDIDYIATGQIYQVSNNVGLAIKKDGTVWSWNRDNINPVQIYELSNISSVAIGHFLPNLATVKLGEVLGATPSPQPFLSLPWDYKNSGESFDYAALHPSSWFDHKYPLQDTDCCTLTTLTYTGLEQNVAYRSHSGYDYARQDGVVLGTPVLAAAAGLATFIPQSKSGGAGNVIKINHENGYQTWYEHLGSDGLIVASEGVTTPVTQGQVIGYVGMTGSTNGPHVHLSVMKDSNNNGIFTDDYPYGLVDPLGWEGTTTDPWEEWTLNGRAGTKSYNLFTDFHPNTEKNLAHGDSINNDYATVIVPDDAYSDALNVTLRTGPFMSKSIETQSVAPSFLIEAFNTLQQKITQFLAPIEIDYDYSKSDISNIDENSLTVYYYDEEANEWKALPTTIDKNNKKVVTYTTHFTRFALMGNIKDLIAPITQAYITGEKGQDNWYRSDITVSLDGRDNENGIGIESTIYSIDGKDWKIYTNPIVFSDEAKHSLTFMSYDKADNREAIKTLDFNIDKTPPVVSLTTDTTALWPPDGRLIPVVINGSMSDQNISSENINLTDEYGLNNIHDINFGQTILLPATRDGNDRDGRDYTVEASAQDLAGNKTTSQVHILVPHDQRN